MSAGEIVGLLGPNGAGKTTTFRMILGLESPDAGTVVFDGEDVTRQPVFRRARLGLGYLAQEPSTFRTLTAVENLLAVLEWRDDLKGSERRECAYELLERFRLEERADQRAGSLSGGEERRLEIARVLASEPRAMLLDEPFANIDPRTVEELQEILSGLRDQGLGILITDHNVRETLSVTDRSSIVVEGAVLRDGTPDEIVSDPLVRKAYLGQRFSMQGREREKPERLMMPPVAEEPIEPIEGD